MNVVAIVQARMGSTRMPNKVMKEINGIPIIELLLKRLHRSKEVNKIVIATSTNNNNDILVKHIKSLGYSCMQGSEDDVLERYAIAASKYKADIIVRITGDCPLIDPILVDHCVKGFKENNVDYFSNNHPETFPDGLDVEVFSISALKSALNESNSQHDHEHVTPYIRNSGKFELDSMRSEHDYSSMRWTLDEPEDFEVISNIFDYFFPRYDFDWEEVLELAIKKPELFMANQKILRNEGSLIGSGQKLWKRAKKVIPGGNMMLSKRSEMFLPDQWPSYYSKAKGCKIWDLDDNEYIDMSIMSIGTNTLGYGNEEIDNAVRSVVSKGNMSTLNCPEEVYLAEKLVDMHPWSDMVKFARSGGEANAIAVRIARAASGKDNVAICGYHGWHDWYLAANLGDDENLRGHLLPGLEPNGVPESLKGTVFPFEYNDYNKLRELVDNCDIGVIKMEVVRNKEPENQFLQKVRKLATDNGIVLIFDECTSGFRETFGGIHKKYKVDPDIAMFGKTLGNGYAITAIIGKKEVMDAAQSTFISSTFWTERIGPVAALKTLEIMEQIKSWETITKMGLKVKSGWKELADDYNLAIEQFGIPSLAGFNFLSPNALAYKTLVTQEMLKNGFLASNLIYVSTEHTDRIIKDYFDLLKPIFANIRDCEDGRDIHSLLNHPICHSGFRRLS